MIAKVCDCCGKPVPGAADDEREYDDADVFFGAEAAFEFEDLCPHCLEGLREAIESFVASRRAKPAPTPRPELERAPEPIVEPQTAINETAPAPRSAEGRFDEVVVGHGTESVTKMFKLGRPAD